MNICALCGQSIGLSRFHNCPNKPPVRMLTITMRRPDHSVQHTETHPLDEYGSGDVMKQFHRDPWLAEIRFVMKDMSSISYSVEER